MTKKTTQQQFSENPRVLYLAFEMGSKNWKLGFSTGFGQTTRLRNIESGDLVQWQKSTQQKSGLSCLAIAT
jgi:hypothetical protein